MVDNIYDELQWRGLIYDETEGVRDLLAKEKLTLYNGFDPTSDSLHVGHLVPLVALARFQRFGHTPIAVAGGGTAMVGDPSGRSEERNLLSREEIEANLAGIRPQLAKLLDFDAPDNAARLVNNADWLASLDLLEFLRDVGKHFTVNYMMAKESVRGRLEREEGLSFTEFSYMLLQAYDYLTLFERTGCRLQAGGSDQWGNIVAGTELIRRTHGERAFGIVYPLITGAGGAKFGKTASGTDVWLDPEKTSPYRFYQWWLNTDDSVVVDYLKYFTFLDREEIQALAQSVEEQPHLREAQRRLAEEMTHMVHGEAALEKAQLASEVLFGGELTGLGAADIADIFADVPSNEVSRQAFENGGMLVIDLVADSTLASSRGQAKRDIRGGGVYLNNERVEDLGRMVTLEDTIEGQFLVLRKGRRRYHLVRIDS
ncbi:MAG: tyrosine--tRNA ligase [Candidatus Promineifilaceae bacterium]|nr:tyrosine--tRNA ligase [Candidatus Promineifilaceae bacterium]